jgi:hypothetical protein
MVHADEVHVKWTKVEIPLKVYRHSYGKYGSVSAEGFWQSTSEAKDKQLVFPIAVKISCYSAEKVCRETEASVTLGILQSDLLEYDISSWDDEGVVADDTDEGKSVTNSERCKPFQDANSYSLHGGQLMVYPPVSWDPLAKPVGSK